MTKEKLNWKALMTDRCPKCNCKLFEDTKTVTMKQCAMFGAGGFFGCDFEITIKRLEELKAKMALDGFDHDNAESLANL